MNYTDVFKAALFSPRVNCTGTARETSTAFENAQNGPRHINTVSVPQ